VTNRLSQLYPKFNELCSSSSNIGLMSLFDAANICLERRLDSHGTSDENFAKLKLALEQMRTTIERTEQIDKTLDHLEHLPKHIPRRDYEHDEQTTPFEHIATRFYSTIDWGQQARELFREQMSKQMPNSFVTCCNTIVTTSVDESTSELMNDETTIIRCHVATSTGSSASTVETKPSATTNEGMLKGLECLLLSEPMSTATTSINNDESFLALEQQCQMDADSFVERPRRKTIVETNVAAVVIDDRMDADCFGKENRTPKTVYMHEPLFDKLDVDMDFISPIISVPMGQ
jgi:hypothetical protein